MERKNLFCLAFVLHFAFILLGPGCAAAQVRQPEAVIGHGVGADDRARGNTHSARAAVGQPGERRRAIGRGAAGGGAANPPGEAEPGGALRARALDVDAEEEPLGTEPESHPHAISENFDEDK